MVTIINAFEKKTSILQTNNNENVVVQTIFGRDREK